MNTAATESARLPHAAPSSLYRSHFWRLGLGFVRSLPRALCVGMAQTMVRVYWHIASARRRVVIENLLPAVSSQAEARQKARLLFRQFATKLVDLWRYEAGLPVDDLFGNSVGWENFVAADERKNGILLVTPHLGDWEFGGPWLARRGVSLQVITLAEPGEEFTQLRQAARARWNIETIVIRDDPFAFVEVIRRLESGATVALLIDRPPPPTATTVELFGQPFNASIAAAELARASGCALLPVYIVRSSRAYSAHVLPELTYDRIALREREARRELTQRMMTAFEPAINQHLDQWYHFVPIWPK